MDRGHQVEVLTGFPNHPGGKVYEGYKVKFFQKEVLEGIPVVRVPLYPSHDTSAVKRIANYMSYAMSAAMLGPWLTKKPDLIYVYHPPPTTYIPAFVLKLRYRVPVVYDIQDFWPDTLAATGMFSNKLGLRLVDGYCKTFYKAANKIVVLSPGFKKKLIKKGVPESKIEVVYNWSVDSQITEVSRNEALSRKLGFEGKFNILFAGNMGTVQNLETVLKTAEKLKDGSPCIQFVFIGGGVEVAHLKQVAEDMQLMNVRFLPRCPRSEIDQVLSLADVLLVHLKDDPLFRITIPSKIQGYMAAGRPILVAVPGDAADLVQRADAGLACPSDDLEQLASKVLEFSQMSKEQLQTMGQQGKSYYLKHLSMEVGVTCFEEIFSDTIETYSRKK